MKITRLSSAVLESNFDWTLVKVETDAGLAGYGEAFVGPGLPAVIREFGGILEGEDPTNIDRNLRRMRGTSVHASPGLTLHAIAGIECALLDVTGKRFGLPVWQLLGGKYREAVPIYADCHAGDALESIGPLLVPRTPRWMRREDEPQREATVSLKHHGWDASGGDHLSPEAYGRRAREMVGRGFRILKFDVDVPTPFETDEYNRHLSHAEIEHMASLVAATREAVGGEIGLAIDCHWNYSVQAAIDMGRAIDRYKLMWFEDPVPPENIRAIGVVQRNMRTPVATGENHYYRIDFERLILEAGLRVLAPDVQKMGLWEGRKLADLADMHYVNLTWHNISGPIGTLAGVHLCAATPNVIALEWHAASVPFFDRLVKNSQGPMIRNGKIAVPDAPGLGVELDEDAAYPYRKPGEEFF
ncbi:MAG: mandelate racemase/muconate lactonizing enzyme family protein [Bryobacterales bacterium]|nr:mandelate racemase/muconate lactonizing enzyme family protein [Bryobacterales bacterium]